MSQIDGNSVKSNEKSTENVHRRYRPWMTTHTNRTYLPFFTIFVQMFTNQINILPVHIRYF